jgi:hypothetical protein
MPVKTIIADFAGQTVAMEDAAIKNIPHLYPPMEEQRIIPFRQYLTLDGTAGGTNDMRVNGSVTPVDFYVKSDPLYDRYITTLSFIIADASASLNQFGNITALTNGCRLFYQRIVGDIDIHDSLKTNFNFVRLCLGQPAFGDAASAFRAPNVVGASEAYIPVLDLKSIMPPVGLQLLHGSQQKLVLRVRDNVSAIDGFNCIAYGFDRV